MSLGCKWVSLETVEDGEEGKAFVVRRAQRLNLDLPSDGESPQSLSLGIYLNSAGWPSVSLGAGET